MAHVVCEPCGLCEKDRRGAPCVLACAADAFSLIHFTTAAGKKASMNVINPTACTDCRDCVAVCPSRAIFHEDIVPDEWQRFVPYNYLQSAGPGAEHLHRPQPPGESEPAAT
jgi:ferredoxin